MTITAAKYANAQRSIVEVQTLEAGAVLVPLDGPDVSGGWRDVLYRWVEFFSPDPYIEPVQTRSVSEHLAAFGFDAIALVNLLDTAAKFAAQGVPLPPKCAATREWINAAQLAYASGQTLPDAPYTLPELLAEIAPLLQP
ncbi:hypothetical protein TSACC_21714 [Terrimicrobium sacchariphilum]|uniref:Uncharacterized protein n=1 Tax=Terrimicrobium sacchariphilum TaxID=690879 RepID=A0A146G724_TERSA|nr:hypothetical protein [Terrimicrobium sacchariphilum]GAT33301.1 hypothetical protein TSACC_21714 [Terrimicrobium sacchariphilum]